MVPGMLDSREYQDFTLSVTTRSRLTGHSASCRYNSSMKIDRPKQALACILVAIIALVTAAFLVDRPTMGQSQVSQASSLSAPPENSTITDIGQWCVDHNNSAFKRTLSSNARNFLRACVELWGPTPAPTSTPTVLPTTVPPATTEPPAPTVPPTSPPVVTVTHGRDINQSNTGYQAWTGATGEHCTDAALTVYIAKVNASALGDAATCVWLKAGITVDAPITLTAARIDSIRDSDPVIRSDGPKLVVQWSTINGGGTNGTYSVGGHNVDVYRSQIVGSSDGVRFEGMNIVESYIRTALVSPEDHNDGIQAYQASAGGSILRCNIDSRPGEVNGGSDTAPIFLADNSVGEAVIRDNWLAGGGYTLRLHEAMTYRITGNVIADGTWGFGPVSTSNSVPGAFLEWGNNTTSGGVTVNP